jgi:hypothetical protein
MANHKRGRPKQRRAGCLLCKPHKLSSAKKTERRRGRREAILHELQALGGHIGAEDPSVVVIAVMGR